MLPSPSHAGWSGLTAVPAPARRIAPKTRDPLIDQGPAARYRPSRFAR